MLQNSKKLLILIDGSSYLYRAYYAFPLLTNSIREPTGAIYGFLIMLRSIMFKYNPNYVGIVFDSVGKTFRDELFQPYKSCRTPMPYNLSIQLKTLKKIITAMGFCIIIIPNVEADDVIGTLALKISKKNIPVFISTSDKDMAQLVSNTIRLINGTNHTILKPTDIIKKFGVSPKLIIDLLALMGDPSDNIPGIHGIGIKTALCLLQEIGDLKTIYNNLSSISNLRCYGSKNLAQKMIKYKDIAFLSYKLATIKTDVDLMIYENDLMLKKADINTLNILFNHYEIKSSKLININTKM